MAVVTITKENFEAEVLHSTKPVLLDFWATWCGPCRMLAPILEELSGQHPELKIVKVDVALTPVPGGVGSVTSAVLCKHTVQAAEKTL